LGEEARGGHGSSRQAQSKKLKWGGGKKKEECKGNEMRQKTESRKNIEKTMSWVKVLSIAKGKIN